MFEGDGVEGREAPPEEPADVLVLDDPGEESWSAADEAAWLAALEEAGPPDDDACEGGSPPTVREQLGALLDAPPSPHVLARLTELEASGLDAHERVLALRLWDRAASWVAARSAEALVAVVPDPAPPRPGGRLSKADLDAVVVHESARLEAACALGLTTGAVRHRVAEAHLLHERPATLRALDDGSISPGHARTVVHELLVLDSDPGAQAAVEQELLARARASTVRSTRDLARRLVLAADPEAAQRRHAAAVAGRGVSLSAEPDGIIEMIARLEAGDALGMYDALSEAAERAWLPGDERTLDQRRADVLVDLVTGRSAAPVSDGSASQEQPGTPPAESKCAPDSDGPGEKAPAGSEVDGDAQADADTGVPESAAPSGQGSRRPPRRRRPQIGVVVGATTLVGNDDTPAHLRGYGPISADQARRITADGELHRLLVEPASGRLLDLGRTRYRPPESLQEYVRARDRTCRAPGCSTDAVRTEIDHDLKWGADGRTDQANLHCGCGTHHRCKDHGGWVTSRDTDGSTRWTSPTGHTYNRPPATYAEFLPRPGRPGAGPPAPLPPTSDPPDPVPPDPVPPECDEEPPF